MATKPTYEELEQMAKKFEKEAAMCKVAEEALRKSEQKYQDLYENAPDMFVSVDAKSGRILSCNQTTASTLGYNKEEIIGRHIFRFYHPDCENDARKYFKLFLKTGEVHDTELKVTRKDGSSIDVSLNVSAVRDKQGKILYSRSIWRDITKRKRAEERIKQQTEFLNSVLDSLPNPFYVIDTSDYTVKLANYAAHLDHLSERSTCYALTHRSDRPCGQEGHPCPVEIIKETKQPVTVEHIHYDKDGNRSNVDVHAYPIFDSEGNVSQIIESCVDITQRKQAEEALRKSEMRYRAIVEDQAELICRFLPDGTITFVNGAFCRYFAKEREDLIGQTFMPLVLDVDRPILEKHLTSIDPENPVETHEYRVITPDGQIRWQRWTNRVILGEDGRVTEFQAVGRDITERKMMREALKESSEKVKLFAYSVSHDLKSPAVGIYGLTKRLHKQYRDILDQKGGAYCDQILKAAEQITTLVDNINVYISTKETPLSFEIVNIKELLQMVKAEFSAHLDIRQVTWLEPEIIPEFRADRLSVMRVLRNLVDNALKYGGDDLTEIRIGHKESDEFHILFVSDDGKPISRQDSKKIFGLFQRNETSKGVEGAGLGLAIVKEVAEKHRGEVWLEPGQDKGPTFCVSISKSL